jgi:hypothetical protein
MTNLLKTAAILLFSSTALLAQPTDNPYRTRYNPITHWTDSLKWSTVTDVTTLSNVVAQDGTVDSLALQNALTTISNAGGGVLYFPPGEYKFGYDLYIPTGVILRGETPTVANATDNNFRPATKFIFPKYEPVLSGNGTPNNTAFKEVKPKKNAYNIGLVNIDLNRAGVAAYPTEYEPQPQFNNTRWPKDINYNLIFMGIRSNNVAIPDPAVPAAASGQQPAQEGWQRYVWRFSSNFGIYVSRNAVVANCRINDEPTDSYNQPGYVLQNGTHPNCFANGQSKLPADGSGARFEVTDHLGIDLNRAKVNKDGPIPGNSGVGPNGLHGIYGFLTYAQPWNEPQLFATGNEIRDCWVYKTRRVGIIAAGNGLVVEGNVVRDAQGKIAFIRPNGTSCETNNSATHENRGIDVSGWNVKCNNNDIEVFQHKIGGPNGYPTVDGEGILVQECCGGTQVKDYEFKYNKLSQASSGYIGLWKMRTMYNVVIDSNTLGCKPIFLTANTNNASFSLFNCRIVGNTEFASITSDAGAGGNNLLIQGNVACQGSSGNIIAPGFATVQDNVGGTWNPGAGQEITVPTVVVTSPMQGTLFNPAASVLITFNATGADSVRVFMNTTNVSGWMAGNTESFIWTASTLPGDYYITVEAKNSNTSIYSTARLIRVVNPASPTAVPVINQMGEWMVYPNPSNGEFQLKSSRQGIKSHIKVMDVTGRTVRMLTDEASSAKIDLSKEAAGVYFIKISNTFGSQTLKLIKE